MDSYHALLAAVALAPARLLGQQVQQPEKQVVLCEDVLGYIV